MTKAELRKLYLQKRLSLTEADYMLLCRQLCERFFMAVDLSFVQVLHIFLPIREKNEVDTWLMIDRIRREFPHVRISLPKILPSGKMENIYFEGLHQLEKSAWGIEEPRQGVPTPAEKIDLVLVPLLCVDKAGHRVGYGKGYYDRLLQACKPSCKKIGLSFFEPVEVIDDVNEWDMPLDGVLTPTAYFPFAAR